MTTAPIIPNPDLRRRATEALHWLKREARYALVDHHTDEELELPAEVYSMLRDILAALARNQAVSVLPTNLELTTNQAADMLNVSRGYVIKLLDSGQLRHRMVGTHRRVRLDEILALRGQMQRNASRALDEIAEIDKDLDGLSE